MAEVRTTSEKERETKVDVSGYLLSNKKKKKKKRYDENDAADLIRSSEKFILFDRFALIIAILKAKRSIDVVNRSVLTYRWFLVGFFAGMF